MYLQRLYIGLNDKDMRKQVIKTECAKNFINEILKDNYTSYTIIETEGYFLGEREHTLIVEYICENKEVAINNEHIRALKEKLNQYAILQMIQVCNFDLV